MARKRRSGIYIKPANRGKLRSATKTKKGQKIPKSTLSRLAKSSNPTTRKRAQFALNASKWRHGGKKSAKRGTHRVQAHTRHVKGKRVRVKSHRRRNPR